MVVKSKDNISDCAAAVTVAFHKVTVLSAVTLEVTSNVMFYYNICPDILPVFILSLS